MKLKDKFTSERYNKINDNALLCELSYSIGRNKELYEYIDKELENISGADSYIIFYMFCNFVVDMFNKSQVCDILELIENNYIRLVGEFKKEYCQSVGVSYKMVVEKDNEVIGIVEVRNGYGQDKLIQRIKDLSNIKNVKDDFRNGLNEVFDILDKEVIENFGGRVIFMWSCETRQILKCGNLF